MLPHLADALDDQQARRITGAANPVENSSRDNPVLCVVSCTLNSIIPTASWTGSLPDNSSKRSDQDAQPFFMRIINAESTAIAELETYGLSLRIINLLEDNLGIIWLEDLLSHTAEELRDNVPNLGKKSVQDILDSVARFNRSQS